MGKVRVGIVGVGNCASSLVQGLAYYAGEQRAGLANPICAGYSISDISISAAFDVDARKIGRDLSEAITAGPNNALQFSPVPPLGVSVVDGALADGVGESAAGSIEARGSAELEDIAAHLRETDTRVLLNFLPTGSQRASELYAEAALRAACAFVNCIPSVIARSPAWAERFEEAGLPLIGDDLKSQFGATLVHHGLLDLLAANGLTIRSTHQIVGGGNMDFLNLQDPGRVASKRATKLHGLGDDGAPEASAHFGAQFIPFLEDRKVTFIQVEAEAFGGTRFELELRMTLEDSPSAAGNALDAARYMQAALDHGLAGVIKPVAALLMKAPPTPMSADDARARVSELEAPSRW